MSATQMVFWFVDPPAGLHQLQAPRPRSQGLLRGDMPRPILQFLPQQSQSHTRPLPLSLLDFPSTRGLRVLQSHEISLKLEMD